MSAYENIKNFEDTLEICEKGYYMCNGVQVPLKLSRVEMKRVRVFLPEEVHTLSCKDVSRLVQEAEPCRFTCENADSYALAIRRLNGRLPGDTRKEILVLNLANPVNVGGGVSKGARAQEEDLCRRSTLYASLSSAAASEYYEYNRSLHTWMGSDGIIITPQVEVFKDEKGVCMDESVIVAVMTCAAPCLRCGMEGLTQVQYEDMVYNRILGMLRCAAFLGYKELVLGAFGCGAFWNDAKIVSDLFCKAIKDFEFGDVKGENLFRQIDFAVLSKGGAKYNFKEFYRNFGGNNFYSEEKAGVTQNEEAPVLFWHEYEEKGYFSNWYPSPFVVDDVCYNHVEQYLMAQKAKLFHDVESYAAILKAHTPKECKALGRNVDPFHAETWAKVRYEVLKAGVRAKFNQNEGLKQLLLATGNCVIAEASPLDDLYGIGISAEVAKDVSPDDWSGENLLGKALMEIRDELKSQL